MPTAVSCPLEQKSQPGDQLLSLGLLAFSGKFLMMIFERTEERRRQTKETTTTSTKTKENGN